MINTGKIFNAAEAADVIIMMYDSDEMEEST